MRTGKEQAEKQAQDLSDALGFIRTALLVFAAVALLVGSFLIFNTFSVTVAQRTKEFALLRTLGASRGQVLRSVLAETFVIGLVASLIGIACGLALAPGLAALLSSFGIDLGTTSTVLEPRTDRRRSRGRDRGHRRSRASCPPGARPAIEPVAAMRDSVTPGAGRAAPAPDRRSRPWSRRSASRCCSTALLGDPGAASATATRARRRQRADDLRLRAAGADARAPAERPDRPPAGALPGPHRPLAAREHPPPAAAHGGHRLGADDRRRARRARGDLRRRPARDDRPGHRRAGQGREHRHPRGRLLAAAVGHHEADRAGRRRHRRVARCASRPASWSARPATRR